MRVALIHNDSAGDTSYTTGDLEHLLRDAGFEVESFTRRGRLIREAISRKPSAIVVAGGDGTVAKVAIECFEGGGPPLYVLPVGTSNNIARTLGAYDTVPKLVESLRQARASRLDIGVVVGPWGREPFVEAAGFGFIGTMLERDGTFRERMARAGRAARGMFRPSTSNRERANRGVARLVRQQPSAYVQLHADGDDMSGEYIAVVVMNIREVGPNVRLAPGAVTDDQRFDLLLVRPDDREALSAYVESGAASHEAPPGITKRVTCVEFPWPRSGGHVDDRPWPNGHVENEARSPARIEIAGAIDVLLP